MTRCAKCLVRDSHRNARLNQLFPALEIALVSHEISQITALDFHSAIEIS